jgi:hypothetical protein
LLFERSAEFSSASYRSLGSEPSRSKPKINSRTEHQNIGTMYITKILSYGNVVKTKPSLQSSEMFMKQQTKMFIIMEVVILFSAPYMHVPQFIFVFALNLSS